MPQSDRRGSRALTATRLTATTQVTTAAALFWGMSLLNGTTRATATVRNGTTDANATSPIIGRVQIAANATVEQDVNSVTFGKPTVAANGLRITLAGTSAVVYVAYELL